MNGKAQIKSIFLIKTIQTLVINRRNEITFLFRHMLSNFHFLSSSKSGSFIGIACCFVSLPLLHHFFFFKCFACCFSPIISPFIIKFTSANIFFFRAVLLSIWWQETYSVLSLFEQNKKRTFTFWWHIDFSIFVFGCTLSFMYNFIVYVPPTIYDDSVIVQQSIFNHL